MATDTCSRENRPPELENSRPTSDIADTFAYNPLSGMLRSVYSIPALYFADRPEENSGAFAKRRAATANMELHASRSVASDRISAPASALRRRKSRAPPRFQVS